MIFSKHRFLHHSMVPKNSRQAYADNVYEWLTQAFVLCNPHNVQQSTDGRFVALDDSPLAFSFDCGGVLLNVTLAKPTDLLRRHGGSFDEARREINDIAAVLLVEAGAESQLQHFKLRRDFGY
jgi:hypothetical protein